MNEKVRELLRDYEGTVSKKISASSFEEAEVIIASIKRTYKEARAFLFSYEKRNFDEISANLYKLAEIKRKSFEENGRLETLKKVLFE